LILSYLGDLKTTITAQRILGQLATVSGRETVMKGGGREGMGLEWAYR
jgi:hypothetical protein